MLATFLVTLALPRASAAEKKTAAAVAIPALLKKMDFQTDVLPIFKRNCLACHNATDAKGDLVLETPATILKGGENGAAVVPKRSQESSLLKCSAKETKPFMPPKDNKVGAEALKPDELAVLKAWIDQGATGTVSMKEKPVVWKPLPPGLHPILAVAVTGDGQYAACGRANQIFIYHVPTGQIVARLTDPKLAEQTGRSGYRSSAQRDFVQSLAFSPDGLVLASGEYRMVKLWQREPKLPQFTLGADPVSAIATSADGKWIATVAKDNVIRIWDAATGKQAKELPGHTAAVGCLKFLPDSAKLASGSADKTIRVWDLAAGKIFAQTGTANEVSALAWTFGGKQLVTAGGDNVIRQWILPAQAGGELKPGKDITGHTQPVTCLEAFTADGKQLLSGSRDGTIRHWAVDQNRQVRQMDHGAPVLAIAATPNGKIFASAGGNSARLWSADKGAPLGEMKGDHRARITQSEHALAFAKSEVAYWKTTSEAAEKNRTAKTDAMKKATDAIPAAEKAIAEKEAAREKITDDKLKPAADDAVKFAESSKKKAEATLEAAKLAAKQAEQSVADAKTASENAAALLQKAEAEIAPAKKALADSEKPVRAVVFAPNGLTIATAGDDQIIQTWTAENGAACETFASQLGPVQTLAYTADGRLISGSAKSGAVVWRSGPNWTLARTIGTGDEKSPLAYRVPALDFSADGKLLATGGGMPSRNGEVKIWRTADSTLVREILPSHSDTVFGVGFSPDGKFLASASADKFVKIFDTASGKLVKQLAGHTHYVFGVSWRADGRTIASCGADKAVKLWSFPPGEQLKSVETYNKEVTAIRFVGLGGEMLTASGDARVRMLKEDGSTLRDYSGGKGFIFSTAITPDGQTVLGGGQDSILRVWNGATGKSLFSLDPPIVEMPAQAANAPAPKR